MEKLPVIGITMGDPAGIGPEIILSLLAGEQAGSPFTAVVIGSQPVFEGTAESLGLPFPFRRITDPGAVPPTGEGPFLLDLENIRPSEYAVGQISREAGKAAIESVLTAVSLAGQGRIDAMVTAPIHKEAIRLAGFGYPGHTELIAEKTGTRDFAMMLMGGPLRVILVTTHLPLRKVPSALTTDGIFRKILLADEGLRSLGRERPRIAVAGLNPHGGEGGIFGDEEKETIAPAVGRARESGIDATGPLPPDTVFHKAYHGIFDAVVCMYHDQGLIPLKMIAFDKGVNVTLGLPIIRTSVDHGTAFDVAGKGVASHRSLLEAIRVAVQMVQGKEGHER